MNKAQTLQAFAGKRPLLGSNVFVAPNSSVVGDVKLGSGSSVWYGAVIRGESPTGRARPPWFLVHGQGGRDLDSAAMVVWCAGGGGGVLEGPASKLPAPPARVPRTGAGDCFQPPSLLSGAALRPAVPAGDVNSVTIGEKTNVQDNALIHVARHNPTGQALPTRIGSSVTIGPGATIHAAVIEDCVVVGMGATVMDGAKVGARPCLRGARRHGAAAHLRCTAVPPFVQHAGA